MWTRTPDLSAWEKIVANVTAPTNGKVTIAMIGKYVDLTESYKSLTEALHHCGFANEADVEVVFVDSEQIAEQGVERCVRAASDGRLPDAFLIPGGFGVRGSEGKIRAAQYAREQKIPYLGICLGLQIAVIEYARHVAGLTNATSSEFDQASSQAVIDIMESQRAVQKKGGSMRLGAYPCCLVEGTRARQIYGRDEISERHRHRFEVNNAFRDQLVQAGLVVSGTSPNGELVEIIEIKDHPWFVGVQFHPEFRSTPRRPHPLFSSFIQAAVAQRQQAGRTEPATAGGNGSTTNGRSTRQALRVDASTQQDALQYAND